MTAREAILQVLADSDRPLAIFEFGLMGVAQTSISARLRELARDGAVVSFPVKGQKYTTWALTPADLVLNLQAPKAEQNLTPPSLIRSGAAGQSASEWGFAPGASESLTHGG